MDVILNYHVPTINDQGKRRPMCIDKLLNKTQK